MRFSEHQQTPPSDPVHSRGRRRAKFVRDIKAEVKEAALACGVTLADLAKILECNKSTVSRKLDAATNVEIFSLFDFAEALGKEWSIKLHDRRVDTARLFEAPKFKTSWTPVVPGGGEKSRIENSKVMVKEIPEFKAVFEDT